MNQIFNRFLSPAESTATSEAAATTEAPDPLQDLIDEDERDDDEPDGREEEKAASQEDDKADEEITPLGEDDADTGQKTDVEIKPGNLAETLKLDESIPEEHRKRLIEHAEGIDKLVKRQEAEYAGRLEVLTENEEFLGQSQSLAQELDHSPKSATTILARLIQSAATLHKVDPDDIAYEIYEMIADGKVPDISRSTPRAKTESKPDPEIAQLQKRIDELENDPTRKATQEEAKSRAADARVEKWLDDNANRVIAKADKTLSWKVTRVQVKEAVKSYPNSAPLDALKSKFPDDYKNAGTKRTDPPGLLPAASKKGGTTTNKPPDEYSARDAYVDLGLRG